MARRLNLASAGLLLWVAVLLAGCGGTGGGSGAPGGPFVITDLPELSLSVLVDPSTPEQVTIIARLRDPRGVPFPGQVILLLATFLDATIIPGEDNEGIAVTDGNGEAEVTVIAGLTTGRMQVIAEVFRQNVAAMVTVDVTDQGFISLGPLGVIPAAVTFVNPRVGPDAPGPTTTFNAVGGTPPYGWDNGNKDLGSIAPTGLPGVGEKAEYTLTGPIPTDQSGPLQDTITLLDAGGGQADATVRVIFADCSLAADGTDVTLTGTPGNNFSVDVSDGVPPFTVTQLFPGSVLVDVAVIDGSGTIIPGEVCDETDERCVVILTLPQALRPVDPGEILIRDARGCTATVTLTVELCGNRIVDAGEECDGSASLSCEDVLGPGATGTVSCTDECSLDTESCQPPPDLCGNNTIDPGEQCDQDDLGGRTCADLLGAGATGELFCTDECTFDTGFCQPAEDLCGNGVIDPGEQCDTLALGGATCATLGFAGGGLVCDSDCAFDTSGCT